MGDAETTATEALEHAFRVERGYHGAPAGKPVDVMVSTQLAVAVLAEGGDIDALVARLAADAGHGTATVRVIPADGIEIVRADG